MIETLISLDFYNYNFLFNLQLLLYGLKTFFTTNYSSKCAVYALPDKNPYPFHNFFAHSVGYYYLNVPP